jgi:putative sporulation protein YyaC
MGLKEELYGKFVQEFSVNLGKLVKELELTDLIFLCVGTDRVTGDSFGPLVGYKLKELYKEERRVHVFGDLETHVSVSNISEIMGKIKEEYEKPFIIAIDSAVSSHDNIGKVVVGKQGISLGSGLNKESIKVGDISIKGVVSEDVGNPKQNFVLLQNTSLNLVIHMADVVAKGMYDVINI